MDANGSRQAVEETEDESTFFPAIPKRETNRGHQGKGVYKWAPQRAYIPKEDAALPTVSTESTFITAMIAAREGRRVRCYNVPSAFVNTDVDEDVIMVLKGELTDMMIQIAPKTGSLAGNVVFSDVVCSWF